MRVSCPACQATYDVPESRIGTGRKLRCARCQHAWRVEGKAAEPAPAVAEPEALPRVAPPPLSEAELPPPLPDPPAAPKVVPPPLALAAETDGAPRRATERQDRSGALMVAWMASLIVLLAFVAALFLYRVEIIEAWAPAERFYALFGMGVSR